MSFAEGVRVSMLYDAGVQAGERELFHCQITSPDLSEAAKREIADHFHRRHKLAHPRIATNPASKGFDR